MASRFVVAVALFAVCHSSPVLENGIDRDGRSLTYGEGLSINYGGRNQATASVSGNTAQATGTNDYNGADTRDGLGNLYPGKAYARVGTSDTAVSNIEFVPQTYNSGAYYPVPAPATVVTYQQNFDAPAQIPTQIRYQAAPQASVAQSVVNSNGGYGSAASNASPGLASSNSRTQGDASASSLAQNSDVLPVAPPASENYESTIVAAKTQGLNNVYTPAGYGYASSNANANGPLSSAASSAKTGPTRKSIHWRFGTAYDNPAAISSAKSVASSNGGSANARADANNPGYAVYKSGNIGAEYGSAHTYAASDRQGSASANADANNLGGAVKTVAQSNGNGSANSNANVNGGWGTRYIADDLYKSQGLITGYRVATPGNANAAANTSGWGSALANAHSG